MIETFPTCLSRGVALVEGIIDSVKFIASLESGTYWTYCNLYPSGFKYNNGMYMLNKTLVVNPRDTIKSNCPQQQALLVHCSPSPCPSPVFLGGNILV